MSELNMAHFEELRARINQRLDELGTPHRELQINRYPWLYGALGAVPSNVMFICENPSIAGVRQADVDTIDGGAPVWSRRAWSTPSGSQSRSAGTRTRRRRSRAPSRRPSTARFRPGSPTRCGSGSRMTCSRWWTGSRGNLGVQEAIQTERGVEDVLAQLARAGAGIHEKGEQLRQRHRVDASAPLGPVRVRLAARSFPAVHVLEGVLPERGIPADLLDDRRVQRAAPLLDPVVPAKPGAGAGRGVRHDRSGYRRMRGGLQIPRPGRKHWRRAT